MRIARLIRAVAKSMGIKMKYRKRTGFILLGILLLFVLIGCFYTPFDPNEMNARLKFSPPDFAHLLGTDNFGRDLFSRILIGSRHTVFCALATIFFGGISGTLIGLFSGVIGGFFDEVLMRIMDCITAFPSILLALVFISLFGTGERNLILALSIVFIPSFSRVARAEALRIKNQDFITASRVMGASTLRIVMKHILPNAKATLLSAFSVGFTNAILAEASLSYLGLGINPPTASLGRMLSEAQAYLFRAPWLVIAPGIFVVLFAFSASLLVEE